MSCVSVPNILLPREDIALDQWAVIACDQYTSQPEYWAETDRIVGDAPSTLRVTLPEVFLEEPDVESRVDAINATMQQYLTDGTLRELPAGFILTERFSGRDCARRGLVAAIDLETYEYKSGSRSLVRPTEKTVEERIPPRLAIRKHALMELPHIMILIDDPDRTVIEPLYAQRDRLEQVYDTDLMQNGGHITGWFVPQGDMTDALIEKLDALSERESFQARYQLTEELPLLNFAIGDGNHSMATAKAYWEAVKPTLSDAERETHPARFCLCEIVNIHDESLLIEPIHRVMFGVDPTDLLEKAGAFFTALGDTFTITDGVCASEQHMGTDTHSIGFCYGDSTGTMTIKSSKWGIAIAPIQAFLDDYLASHPEARIDYIHGDEVVRDLGTKQGNMGFFLPEIDKNMLFRGVIIDGVLPRKTFSMGDAHEKRYYMEAKRIVK